MFVSIYYKPSLFNAHTMILIFHIFMNVNKLCFNDKMNLVSERNKPKENTLFLVSFFPSSFLAQYPGRYLKYSIRGNTGETKGERLSITKH